MNQPRESLSQLFTAQDSPVIDRDNPCDAKCSCEHRGPLGDSRGPHVPIGVKGRGEEIPAFSCGQN